MTAQGGTLGDPVRDGQAVAEVEAGPAGAGLLFDACRGIGYAGAPAALRRSLHQLCVRASLTGGAAACPRAGRHHG